MTKSGSKALDLYVFDIFAQPINQLTNAFHYLPNPFID